MLGRRRKAEKERGAEQAWLIPENWQEVLSAPKRGRSYRWMCERCGVRAKTDPRDRSKRGHGGIVFAAMQVSRSESLESLALAKRNSCRWKRRMPQSIFASLMNFAARKNMAEPISRQVISRKRAKAATKPRSHGIAGIPPALRVECPDEAAQRIRTIWNFARSCGNEAASLADLASLAQASLSRPFDNASFARAKTAALARCLLLVGGTMAEALHDQN